jgi:hypothetical protein
MIPDIAVIISAYAIARLVNEYVLSEEKGQATLRTSIAIIAALVIAYFLFDIYQISTESGNSLGNLVP